MRARTRGVTLVELVMYIVIVSIGVAGILLVMTYTTQHSADPMIRQQALLIAESYMEEILRKPYLDPTAPTVSVCPPPEGGGRNVYDNVCDYNGLVDAGARDQFGGSIVGLEAYNVTVTVIGDTTVTLGPTATQVSNNASVARVLRINLRVTHRDAPDLDIPLTGYRTHYTCFLDSDTDCRPL